MGIFVFRIHFQHTLRPMNEEAPAEALPLVTSAQMQSWDRTAIQELGVPERVLMESAGRAAARIVHELYPTGRVVAAVGGGNNGGDAVVLLRTLLSWGREVEAVPVAGASIPEELLHGWRVPIASGDPAVAFRSAEVIVDGIIGTGARGAPREPQAGVVLAMGGFVFDPAKAVARSAGSRARASRARSVAGRG